MQAPGKAGKLIDQHRVMACNMQVSQKCQTFKQTKVETPVGQHRVIAYLLRARKKLHCLEQNEDGRRLHPANLETPSQREGLKIEHQRSGTPWMQGLIQIPAQRHRSATEHMAKGSSFEPRSQKVRIGWHRGIDGLRHWIKRFSGHRLQADGYAPIDASTEELGHKSGVLYSMVVYLLSDRGQGQVGEWHHGPVLTFLESE